MKRNNIIIIIVFLILILTTLYTKRFEEETKRNLTKYAKNESLNKITLIIDKTIKNILLEESCDDIITFDKNEEGIVELNINNDKINKILNKSTNLLHEEINNKNTTENIYYLVYGISFDNHLLSNIGPQIPYYVKTIGNINTNSKINIKEYGINNSLIESILVVKIELEVILPFVENVYCIEKELTLDSKIIQGKIPTYYSNWNFT